MDSTSFWDWLNYIGHSLSGTAILGALIGWFPPVAALVAFLWYLLQIWESKTMQTWLAKRRALKIVKLANRIKLLEELQKHGHIDPDDLE